MDELTQAAAATENSAIHQSSVTCVWINELGSNKFTLGRSLREKKQKQNTTKILQTDCIWAPPHSAQACLTQTRQRPSINYTLALLLQLASKSKRLIYRDRRFPSFKGACMGAVGRPDSKLVELGLKC